ncbi:unnamed protein product [Lota lota]
MLSLCLPAPLTFSAQRRSGRAAERQPVDGMDYSAPLPLTLPLPPGTEIDGRVLLFLSDQTFFAGRVFVGRHGGPGARWKEAGGSLSPVSPLSERVDISSPTP